MQEVNSIKDITDEVFLIKYGQEFCIPCEMTDTNLKTLESNYEVPFYSCMNTDESIEKGFTALPIIIVSKNGVEQKLEDTSIMMDEDELKNWLNNYV